MSTPNKYKDMGYCAGKKETQRRLDNLHTGKYGK
jgi:hypothetical protein